MDKVTKKTTDDGRVYAEITKQQKSRVFLSDIEKQIENLDKSIAKFQAQKTKLQKVYEKLTK